MVDLSFNMVVDKREMPRQIEPQWNRGMIIASIAISLLGAFTSTQLMCQARTSRDFSGALVWTLLGSLTFGFCSIWSLHEVAMLACELDLPIGVDVPLTVLSSILAVFFTFAALAFDLLWDRYNRGTHGKIRSRKRKRSQGASRNRLASASRDREIDEPLLYPSEQEDEHDRTARYDLELNQPSCFHQIPKQPNGVVKSAPFGVDRIVESASPPQPTFDIDSVRSLQAAPFYNAAFSGTPTNLSLHGLEAGTEPTLADGVGSETTESFHGSSSGVTSSRRSSSFVESNSGSFGIGNIMRIAAYQKNTIPHKNAFLATGILLYTGCTPQNLTKGFLWSLAITGMHYVGILALHIPNGYCTLEPLFVILSSMISWTVCSIGCILMARMETHLAQQFLFSAVATTGVAAMHFTGMRAATFWSHEPPSESRGYPPALAIAIVSIAITTCIAANGLLAHSATVSRNKLAEIVWTRRKLWMAIAQKENAESAAAARSEFIASASHEIRTPLHHLQGYSDLLARTEMSEEGRILLYAIQRATKTLSLITNNVLDWSRLERDGEAVCRPVALDMRIVCESIITLLPNRDEEVEAELMVVVAPNVPDSLFLDETYIHRILMNLVSNALKFTSSGYILLLIEMVNNQLIATVKDSGCGVPSSFLPQLFEPFKQAQTRGSQRGTGLGLSIVKQLLQKMEGNIEVESKHQDTDDIDPDQTGSTFTITIPVQVAKAQDGEASISSTSKIALFHGGNERTLEGLCIAWAKFGFEVVVARQLSDIEESDLSFIWVDIPFLRQNPTHLQQLLDQDRWLVLVPYDSQNALQEIPGLLSTSHFLPIRKPLIWHTIKKNIVDLSQRSSKTPMARTVRFAPNVNIMEREKAQEEPTVKNLVVLLVEDNLINRKLGTKMLTSLGYQVLTADDGEEAIEQVMKHDGIIDAILMDQSMPRKDGITATKEIRAMEAAGTLSRRTPIIAVTAVVSPQAQTLFKLAGTDDFLSKPLSLSRLEETLATHLSLNCK